jgi:predicted phage baseplate assembly protein
MLIYRLNRVTDASRYTFLKLLDPAFKPSDSLSLEEQTRAIVLSLRQADRAVTCADFEKLALEASNRQDASKADGYAKRAKCVARRNLEMQNEAARNADQPNHTSVVVVPFSEDPQPQPSQQLKDVIEQYLDTRRLVTNVIHVVGPRYVTVRVQLTVVLMPDTLASDEAAVRAPLEDALALYLHPLKGGPGGDGWPFGRNVYVSEIYDILDRQRNVDFVKKTEVPAQGGTTRLLDELAVVPEDKSRMKFNDEGELVAVEIRDDELVSVQFDLELEFPTGG